MVESKADPESRVESEAESTCAPAAEQEPKAAPESEPEFGLELKPEPEPEAASAPASAPASVPETNAELRDGQVHVIMGILNELQDCMNALQDRVRLLESNVESDSTSTSPSDAGGVSGVAFTQEYRKLLDTIKSKPIATMDFESLKRLINM